MKYNLASIFCVEFRKWNLSQNITIFVLENSFENVMIKISVTSFRPECPKECAKAKWNLIQNKVVYTQENAYKMSPANVGHSFRPDCVQSFFVQWKKSFYKCLFLSTVTLSHGSQGVTINVRQADSMLIKISFTRSHTHMNDTLPALQVKNMGIALKGWVESTKNPWFDLCER